MTAACPEYVFEVVLHPVSGGPVPDTWWAAFVTTLESRGLSVAEGGAARRRCLIACDGGQAIEADREALRTWAAEQAAAVTMAIGPLIDLREIG